VVGVLLIVAAIVVLSMIVGHAAETMLDAYFPANWRTNFAAALGFIAVFYLAARIEKLERRVQELSASIAQLRRQINRTE
jgi:hypothetical protein